MSASLGNYSEPYINGSTLKRLYSSVVKDNIFQGLLTRDGEAATEKYCEDTSVAQVTVLRILPTAGLPRTLGETTNGGFFNSDNPIINETGAYPINLIDVVDYQCDIPEVQQDMMSTDLAAQRAKILGGQVNRAINACTIAAQLKTYLNDLYTASTHKVEMDASPSTGDYLKYIVKASAFLDEGNSDLGIDTYPIEERAIFVKADYKANLMAQGQLITGSSAGQYMIKDGGLSPDDKSDNVTGFCGRILDMPVYMVGAPIWVMTAGYLGIAPSALDDIQVLIVSALGTGRGLAFNSSIKQIDSPSGAGIRMQPLYRFGAECWDAKSVIAVVKNGFSNPSTGSLAVKAPASRTFTVTYDDNDATSGTVPASQSGKYHEVITCQANSGTLAKTGKTFKGWGEVASATTATYTAGTSTITLDHDMTLYAIFA